MVTQNIINRWNEYRAGTLTPLAVVQCDKIDSEYLIWIYAGSQIIGPISRTEYNEQDVLDFVTTMNEPQPTEGETWQQ